MAREIERAIVAELEMWPGAAVTIGKGKTHPKAVLTFEGKTEKRTFPGTPGGASSLHATLADIRRALRGMGATRGEPESAEADAETEAQVYRKPNPGRAQRPAPAGEKAGLKPTVADQLADHPAAPPPPDPLEELLAANKAAQDDGSAGDDRPIKQAISRRLSEELATRDPTGEAARRIQIDPTVNRSGWGLYTDIEAVDYHLDPCPEPSISNSTMDPLLVQTPEDFAWQHPRRHELVPSFPADPDKRKMTLAKIRGDVVHQLALGKGRGYAVADEKWVRFDTKESKAWKAEAEEAGKTPIKHADFQEAMVLAERVREAIKRGLDGADYQTEVVFMYQEMTDLGPIWVRGMMDVWCPERAMILDPKITARLYDGMIERHALAMGWDRQAALYQRAVGIIFPDLAGRVTFSDVLVNPDPPYVSRLWAPERGWVSSSVRQCLMAFEKFGECMATSQWPAFGDKIHRGPMPPWEDRRRTEQELGS